MDTSSTVLKMALLMMNTLESWEPMDKIPLIECAAACYRTPTCSAVYVYYEQSSTQCLLLSDISDNSLYGVGRYYSWEPADCPVSQGWRYDRSKNFCYMSGGLSTYAAAGVFCEERGGQLVDAYSDWKIRYLQNVTNNNDIWIQSASGPDYCTMMSSSTGQQKTENCSSSAYAFCERTVEEGLFTC